MNVRGILVLALSMQLMQGYNAFRGKRQSRSQYNRPQTFDDSARLFDNGLQQVARVQGPRNRPTCDPSCDNDGICVEKNFCQCKNGFKGPVCRYDKETCSIRKAGFNGNYDCLIYTFKSLCKLTCPENYKLSAPEGTIYECEFALDTFDPPIPRCIYPKGVTVKSFRTEGVGKPLPAWDDETSSVTDWSSNMQNYYFRKSQQE